MIDIGLALTLARACQAAYELNAGKRKALLDAAGLTEARYVQGPRDARALVCSGRWRIIAVQGTQFTAGELPSILENVKTEPVDRGGGAKVMLGYWEQWQALEPLLDGEEADYATGHSMGGAVVHLSSLLGQRVTFGAPKCANAAFYASVRWPTRLVNERDIAPTHPELSYWQPGNTEWLHNGKLIEVSERSTVNNSFEDHMIENYIAALAALREPPEA